MPTTPPAPTEPAREPARIEVVEPIPADPERAEEWPPGSPTCATYGCDTGQHDEEPHRRTLQDPTPATPPTPTDVVDEPGIGAVVRDQDGDEWRHEVSGRWVHIAMPNEFAPWASLLRTYGPLTLVAPATPPAATVGEGDVKALAVVIRDWQSDSPRQVNGYDMSLARAVLAAGPWPRSTNAAEDA